MMMISLLMCANLISAGQACTAASVKYLGPTPLLTLVRKYKYSEGTKRMQGCLADNLNNQDLEKQVPMVA